MYLSFFKKVSERFKQMPAKKRVTALILSALALATFACGMGPVLTYAAGPATGSSGETKGVSYKPGGKAYGIVEPGYFAVTPVFEVAGATYSGNPDYTLLYNAAETASAVQIPDQNRGTLLFIPKTTWYTSSNNSNWWLRDGRENYGRDCSRYNGWLLRMNGYDVNSSAKESRDFIYSSYNTNTKKNENWDKFNNIVFCELTKDMLKKGGIEIGSAAIGDSFKDLRNHGVYRERLYKYLRDSTKSASEYGYYDFSKLTNDELTAEELLQYVVYGEETADKKLKKRKMTVSNLDDDLVKKSQQLWNAFTEITRSSGGSYRTHVYRFNDFTNRSYNYAIKNSKAAAYFSNFKLNSQLPLTFDESKMETNGVSTYDLASRFNHINSDEDYLAKNIRLSSTPQNTEDEGRCRVYCANMYRLGYLDLLLTLYTVAANQKNIAEGKAEAAAESEWKIAINYLLNSDRLIENKGMFVPVWINVQMGTMSVQNTNNIDNNKVQLMFATSQDSVDASYQFATRITKGSKKSDKGLATMSYPYPGYPYRVKTDKNGNPTGVVMNGFQSVFNEKITISDYDYGRTYYERLKLAANKTDGYTKGCSWYSTLSLQRILRKLYDNGKEYPSTNSMANIELIKTSISSLGFSKYHTYNGKEIAKHHKNATKWGTDAITKIWQRMYNANNEGNDQQMYGSFMIMCAPFEEYDEKPITKEEYKFAAKLSISSELANRTDIGPNYTKRYKQQKKAVNTDCPSANEVGYLPNSNAQKFVFCTEKAKYSTADNLWGLEELNEETGKPKNGVHAQLSDFATKNPEDIQEELEKPENAIIRKTFDGDELNGKITATVNDTITLNLAVQSYTNKDNKKDNLTKMTLEKYLNKYMQENTEAKLKVIWTIYRKNPTYKSSGKLDSYGRALYNAEDKWLDISVPSHKDKSSVNKENEPPYYKATDIKSELIRGSVREEDSEADDEVYEDEGEAFDPSGSTESSQTGTPGEEAPNVEESEKTAEDVIGEADNGAPHAGRHHEYRFHRSAQKHV